MDGKVSDVGAAFVSSAGCGLLCHITCGQNMLCLSPALCDRQSEDLARGSKCKYWNPNPQKKSGSFNPRDKI